MLRNERFFESEREIFSVLKERGFEPSLIVDIGASNGAWTRNCLNVFEDGQYLLYEPLYPHLDHYRSGIDKLTASNRRITCRPLALADKPLVADFFITPNSVGSSLLKVSDSRTVQVEVTTLDQDLERVSGSIDILKMDTQGSELRILRGAKSVIPRSRVILVESWLYRGYGSATPLANEIIAELHGYGFRVFGMGGPYFNPENVLYAVDLYFGTPDILELLGPEPFAPPSQSNGLAPRC